MKAGGGAGKFSVDSHSSRALARDRQVLGEPVFVGGGGGAAVALHALCPQFTHGVHNKQSLCEPPTWGLKSTSWRMTVSAPVRLSPWPPARVDSRNANASDSGWLKLSQIDSRSATCRDFSNSCARARARPAGRCAAWCLRGTCAGLACRAVAFVSTPAGSVVCAYPAPPTHTARQPHSPHHPGAATAPLPPPRSTHPPSPDPSRSWTRPGGGTASRARAGTTP